MIEDWLIIWLLITSIFCLGMGLAVGIEPNLWRFVIVILLALSSIILMVMLIKVMVK